MGVRICVVKCQVLEYKHDFDETLERQDQELCAGCYSILQEEADESSFWLELLEELYAKDKPTLLKLKAEASQITAIIVASKKTARKRK